jgi:2-octaprenyl-6-methoxyphenol hydroxylase
MSTENHTPDTTASSNKQPDSFYDIVIIGGGLVGASLAVALENSDKSILVVEPVPLSSDQQPSYDERTVALTYSARQIYSAMDVWEDIRSKGAEPITNIHISNRGHFGQVHLTNAHSGTEALGYVVPTRVIGQSLWNRISQAENVDVLCPGVAENIIQTDNLCQVEISKSDSESPDTPVFFSTIKTKMVILCDGGRSPLNTKVGLLPDSYDYPQSAVLSIVTADKKHGGRAYERFTPEGPLALLPLGTTPETPRGSGRYAVVWTTKTDNLEHRMSLDDDNFLATLQDTFGDRAGVFSKPSLRKSYPLKKSSVKSPTNGRVLALGNAAHTVHPVAGQGFNLGLRDVASLAEQIFAADDQHLGSLNMIEQYIESRARDTRMVERFTHSLIEIFSNEYPGVSMLRNIGLKAVEHCPPAKRFLLNRTMGLHKQKSRLSMGTGLGTPVNTRSTAN